MSRVSVFAVLAATSACGVFLAADDAVTGPGGGGGKQPDGAPLDATIIVDDDGSAVPVGEGEDAGGGGGGGASDAAADAPSSTRCAVGTDFTVRRAFASSPTDTRSVRLVKGHYYYSVQGSPNGLDLGVRAQGANDTFGASQPWFSAFNLSEQHTIPAVTDDALTVVFQSQEADSLQIAKRANATANFPAPSSVSFVGTLVSSGTGQREPYFTRSGRIFFAYGNDVYSGTLSGTQITADTKYDLAPAAWPVVSDDELEIFFMRDSSIPEHHDVYRAHRSSKNVAFANVTKLGALVNVPGRYSRPTWISPDACELYFIVSAGPSNSDFTPSIARR